MTVRPGLGLPERVDHEEEKSYFFCFITLRPHQFAEAPDEVSGDAASRETPT